MTLFHSHIIIPLVVLTGSNLMAVSYYNNTKTKYKRTLELEVDSDFNPRQIDWRKVLDINPDEDCQCYIEDVDCPLDYYN